MCIVGATARLRHHVVNLERLERAVHAAPAAPSLLLAVQDMLVLAVVLRGVDIVHAGYRRALVPVVEQRSHLPAVSGCSPTGLKGERSMPTHRRSSFSAATQAAHAEWVQHMSPSLLLAAMMRSSAPRACVVAKALLRVRTDGRYQPDHVTRRSPFRHAQVALEARHAALFGGPRVDAPSRSRRHQFLARQAVGALGRRARAQSGSVLVRDGFRASRGRCRQRRAEGLADGQLVRLPPPWNPRSSTAPHVLRVQRRFHVDSSPHVEDTAHRGCAQTRTPGWCLPRDLVSKV